MNIVFNGQHVEASIVTSAKGNEYYHFTPADKRERIIATDNPCIKLVKPVVPTIFGLIPVQIRSLQQKQGDRQFRNIR